MTRLATRDPPPEIEEREIALNASDLARLYRALLWLAALFVGSAATSLVINLPTPLFAGMECYLCWCSIAAVIQYFFLRLQASDLRDEEYDCAIAKRQTHPEAIGRSDPPSERQLRLPTFANLWQWIIFFGGLFCIYSFLRSNMSTAGLSRENIGPLRVATVIFLAEGCAFYFFGNFARAVAARVESDALSPILILTRIASLAGFAAAGVIFLFLSTTRDYSAWLGWILLGFTAFPIMETLIRFGARFYQPKSLRKTSLPAGTSLILDAIFGRGHNLKSAVESFEDLLGAKLSEMWIVRYLRQTIESLLLARSFSAGFPPCFTSVPAGSRAVRMLFGSYHPVALSPGLHLTWPWPIEQLEIVETETIRQISLGFDKDLEGPVLWNEPALRRRKKSVGRRRRISSHDQRPDFLSHLRSGALSGNDHDANKHCWRWPSAN